MGADETRRLADRLRYGLYAHATALELARDERAGLDLGTTPPSQSTLSGSVLCKDGSERPFDLDYVLELMRSDPALRAEMDRGWCVSSLIVLGDHLAADAYFDRAPVLEMVRHLRNGVAHGNRFTIRNPAELEAWPAHTRDSACRGDEVFEITPALDGSPVLFEFMGLGDVLDLLISVGTHLRHLAGFDTRGATTKN